MTPNPKALAAAALLCANWPLHAAGLVEVNFVEPNRFTDAGYPASELEKTTNALTARFKSYEKLLADGQRLKIDVLDVDLAGTVAPGPTPRDRRVMIGRADWPTIRLRFVLSAGDKPLLQGEDTIDDMNYLATPVRYGPDTVLPYEERMLDRWFAARIAAAKAQ